MDSSLSTLLSTLCFFFMWQNIPHGHKCYFNTIVLPCIFLEKSFVLMQLLTLAIPLLFHLILLALLFPTSHQNPHFWDEEVETSGRPLVPHRICPLRAVFVSFVRIWWSSLDGCWLQGQAHQCLVNIQWLIDQTICSCIYRWGKHDSLLKGWRGHSYAAWKFHTLNYKAMQPTRPFQS